MLIAEARRIVKSEPKWDTKPDVIYIGITDTNSVKFYPFGNVGTVFNKDYIHSRLKEMYENYCLKMNSVSIIIFTGTNLADTILVESYYPEKEMIVNNFVNINVTQEPEFRRKFKNRG